MSNEVTKAELQEFEKEKEKAKSYSNGEITVYWQKEKCIHSANCIIGLPGVFSANKQPWINMKGADAESVIKTVDTCPSRALLYLKNQKAPSSDTIKTHGSSGNARIQILKNGPALISGDFIIKNAENQQIEVKTEVAAICRCGASRRKPFCDGSHVRIDFKD